MAKLTDEEKQKQIDTLEGKISEMQILLRQNDYKSLKIVAELCETVKDKLDAELPVYEKYKDALTDNQTFRDTINECQSQIEELSK